MADKNMEAQISVEFEEATSRQSLNSGETINTLWSKVKRWLSDLKAVAFSGSYNDLSDKPTTATKDTDGLMSAEDKTKLDSADDTYALKSLYGDTTINVGRKANTPVGVYSTAEGYYTTASGGQSHAEGNSTIAGRDCSHAEGNSTIANGVGAHAEGYNTIAGGDHSHAEGRDTTASGKYSHTEGWSTTASGICSHAGGGSYSKLSSVITDFSPETTNSDIVSAWANTKFSLAKGDYSHSEGYNTLALELGSHAEGRNTIASGTYSHAEGYYTTASGENCSHAEGYYTIASGECSRAEGYYTTASSDCSHAEGRNTIASGICSHAEGNSTTASGDHSHTEGHGTTASGNCSYAGGFYTNALHNFEVAYGHYNVSNDDTLFSIGDGSADDARHNAFEITTTGGKLHDKDIATTDLIPTTLPANGGNADTVGGKVPEKIFYDNGISADLNGATQSGCYATSPDTLNAPSSSWWLVDTMNYNNQFIVQKAHAIGDTEVTVSYIRNYANDVWSDWKEMYTSGNKPYITGSFSGTSLLTDTFDSQPSFAICNDNGTIKYGNIYRLSDVFKVSFENLSDTTHQYIIFK